MWASAVGRRSATRQSNSSCCACRTVQNSQVRRIYCASAAPSHFPLDLPLITDTSLLRFPWHADRDSHSISVMPMQRILAICLLSWLLPAERFAWADARPLHHLRGLDLPGKQPAGIIACWQCQLFMFVPVHQAPA